MVTIRKPNAQAERQRRLRQLVPRSLSKKQHMVNLRRAIERQERVFHLPKNVGKITDGEWRDLWRLKTQLEKLENRRNSK